MKKTKVAGIFIAGLSFVIIALIIIYTVFFSVLGLNGGGSIIILIPLWLFSFVQIILASFFFYFGIRYIKK